MAEFVLSFVMEETLARIVTLVTDEIQLLWGLGEELDRLRDSLDEVRDMLQVAENKQVELKSVQRWLNQLKDAAYDAEDALDELVYEDLCRKQEEQNQSGREVRCFNPFSRVSSCAKKVAFHSKIAHKVRKVNELLGKIRNGTDFKVQIITNPRNVPQIDPNRMTDRVPENPVIGREANVTTILNLFTYLCDPQVPTVVPIVGMGGLGKTALAQMVLKKARDFDFKIWVCVSTNFNVQRILGEMLQTVAGNKLDNGDAILDHLEKGLMGKKFLLVLDDVWDDASKGWEDLWNRLLEISSNNGNAIVVTTRSEEVASTVQSSSQHWHNLNFLSADDCWSIIKKKVCANGEIDTDLERIGREIAKQCGGVPLAAKVLGGTLGFKKEKEAWESIRDRKVFDAAYKKDCVKDILKLSFDHFPSALKSCFAFCSIFPKDCLIEKEELIQLWMAEGFLDSSNGDMGNQYFNALIGNSFFQDLERDAYERVRRCKMHDLVHDLAISVSRAEILTSESSSQGEDLSRIRHVNVDMHKLKDIVAVNAKKLRTVFILKEDAVLDKSWKLKNLRSLNLKGAAVEELPSSIGEWKCLRYLDVSNTKLKTLPESITKLYNLQSLRFLECRSLHKLPRDKMHSLVSLQHIEFSKDEHMPSEFGRLRSLERLSMFVIGSNRGGNIEELEWLNELRGELSIKNLEKVGGKHEAEKANLMEKKRITALEFVWSYREKGGNDEEVLEGLQPHPNIERIKIKNYEGIKFPAWVMKMKVSGSNDSNSFTLLNSLVELTLSYCSSCEQIPSLGILPNLKCLDICGMDNVRYIGNEFYGIMKGNSNGSWKLFPKLKSLCLSGMDSLVEWRAPQVVDSSGVEKLFPCLEELRISLCNHLRKIPISESSSLVKLEIEGCNELSYIFDELDSSSFPCLTSLSISRCESLTSIPIRALQSLEELKISDCLHLKSIPKELACCSTLTSLEIIDCENLSYFPNEILGSLTRLKRLSIGSFSKKLNNFSYLNLIHDSLQELRLIGSYWMAFLPDQLQHLTSLNSLSIRSFYGVEVLPDWLGNLSSLQSLSVSWCVRLKYLPTPTVMTRLSKLTHLHIACCSDDLMQSLIEKSGSEWNKISHIPNVKLTLSSQRTFSISGYPRRFH